MIVRSLPQHKSSIFLTFDDGPDPISTPVVLDLLRREQVQATFFVIAEKARQSPDLLVRIRDEGHAVGNHSLDHRYRNFFRSQRGMGRWIDQATEVLRGLGLESSVGFRPPAGIVTPPLVRCLTSQGEPLVLWNERFYDAVLPWSEQKAKRSAQRLQPGSIVLLHDRQGANRLPNFCTVLSAYIHALRERKFDFAVLRRQDLVAASRFI